MVKSHLTDLAKVPKKEILAQYAFLNLGTSYPKFKLIEQVKLYELFLQLKKLIPINSQIELPRNFLLNIPETSVYSVEDYSVYGLKTVFASIKLRLIQPKDKDKEMQDLGIFYSLINSGELTDLFIYLLQVNQIENFK